MLAEQSLFEFADRIYGEAQKLEQYESSGKFTSSTNTLHKRYDLLRTLLWVESVSLKQTCPVKYHTLVYLYEYNPQEIDARAKQTYYSRLLSDFKQSHGDEALLIPIASNMDLSSLKLILARYEFTSSPVIIIDEKTVVDDIITKEAFETLVLESHKP